MLCVMDSLIGVSLPIRVGPIMFMANEMIAFSFGIRDLAYLLNIDNQEADCKHIYYL